MDVQNSGLLNILTSPLCVEVGFAPIWERGLLGISKIFGIDVGTRVQEY